MRAFMFWLVATSLAGTSIDALATDYCVGSTQQLRAALDSAEVDGADSVIQLRSGSYSLTSNARYEPISESFLPAGKLTLRGGYNSDCSSYSNSGGATTINGSNNFSDYNGGGYTGGGLLAANAGADPKIIAVGVIHNF